MKDNVDDMENGLLWYPYNSNQISSNISPKKIDVDKLFDGSFTFLQIAKLERIFGFEIEVKATYAPKYIFVREKYELSQRIKQYMAEKQIAESDLAEKLNFPLADFKKILTGKFNISVKKFFDVCLCIGLVPKLRFAKEPHDLL